MWRNWLRVTWTHLETIDLATCFGDYWRTIHVKYVSLLLLLLMIMSSVFRTFKRFEMRSTEKLIVWFLMSNYVVPCDLGVRSKCCIFSETLTYKKQKNHSGHFIFSSQVYFTDQIGTDPKIRKMLITQHEIIISS